MSRRPLSASLDRYSVLAWAVLSCTGACLSSSEPTGSDEAKRDAGEAARVCGRGERPVMGSRVDTGRVCIGAPSLLGCIADERACDDAETVVRGGDGVQWWLGDLCIPDGYSTLSDDEAQKILSYPRCGEASDAGTPSASECGQSGRLSCAVGECPLQAQRVDEVRSCLQKSEPAGCWPAGSSCRPQILFGRDAEGARWSFASGCIPNGFTRIEGSEQAQLSGLQECGPAPTPAEACAARSVAACIADERCTLADGIMYDPMRRCRWFEPVEVACVDFTQGCSSVVTHASDPSEPTRSVAFPDSCIPPKWVRQRDRESIDDWPICPEQQPMSARGAAR